MNRKLKKVTKQKEARDKQYKVAFIQSMALSNYLKLCIKLKEVPRLEIVNMLEECQDTTQLMQSNKIFVSHLQK